LSFQGCSFHASKEIPLKEKRKKIWIDRFQTALFLRIALYFVCYQVAVWSLVLVWRAISDGLGSLLGPGVASACLTFLTGVVVLVGVLFAYDAVKYAHHIVGPLARLRKTIKAITAGEDVDLVSFRKGDLLAELKDEFNEMLHALEQRGAVVLKSTAAKQDQKQPVSV
jgi:sensor histidine kinase YesM